MALLGESEIQDFWAIVAGNHFSMEEFNLKEIEDKPTNGGIYAITGKVIVERKSTGVSRQYSAGNAVGWLANFETDLRGQIFGVA